MDNLEEKVILDIDFAKARKQLKDTLADLDIAKQELSTTRSIKERNDALIEEQTTQLKEIGNQIAKEKQEWTTLKHSEMEWIDSQKDAINAILRKEKELEQKEIELVKLNNEIVEARNEQRRLELKNKDSMDVINEEKKILVKEREKIEEERKENDKKMVSFKESVIKLIESVKNV